jgi:hypothetical protein
MFLDAFLLIVYSGFDRQNGRGRLRIWMIGDHAYRSDIPGTLFSNPDSPTSAPRPLHVASPRVLADKIAGMIPIVSDAEEPVARGLTPILDDCRGHNYILTFTRRWQISAWTANERLFLDSTW